jgi:deoxyhypusine synthase
MPCDTKLRQGQTLGQRKTEVREAIAVIDKLLAARRIKVKIGPQGAVVFTGLTDVDRRSITDACIYRMITRSGSAAAKMAISRAEQLAGRNVDRSVVAHGTHSHDGGTTWHPRG